MRSERNSKKIRSGLTILTSDIFCMTKPSRTDELKNGFGPQRKFDIKRFSFFFRDSITNAKVVILAVAARKDTL